MGAKSRNFASQASCLAAMLQNKFIFLCTVALSRNLKEDLLFKTPLVSRNGTGNPGSMIVPQHGSSKITVFVLDKKYGPKICRKY